MRKALLALLLASAAPAQTAVEVVSQTTRIKLEPCVKRGYCSAWGWETGRYEFAFAYRQSCPGARELRLETTKYRTAAGKTYSRVKEVGRSACR
jgi:hypothetical protein